MTGKVPTPFVAFLLFIMTLFLNFFLGALLIPLSSDLGLLVVEPLAILVPTLLLVFALRLDPSKTLRLELPSLTDLLLALPLAFSLTVLNDQLSNITSQVLPISPEIQERMVEFLRTRGFSEWLIKILGIGVGAAVSEEILFRGFIQKGLEQGLRRPSAILLTSFLFALMHLIPQGIPSYLLAGIVLGITALASRSILVPIVIHFVFNMSALVLLNLAQIETLGRPVWIPAGILIPALLIFGITLGHFIRKMSSLPEPRPLGPSGYRPAFASELGPSLERLSGISPERRRLGWLTVGCAVVIGTVVILSLFTFSLYHAYSKEFHASWIEAIKQDAVQSVPQDERRRVEEGFDALGRINEAGHLSWYQLGRLNWLYVKAEFDGTVTHEEVEVLLQEIRTILRASAPVKRL